MFLKANETLGQMCMSYLALLYGKMFNHDTER